MEHLCVGSYIRILTSCAIPAERKFDPFCEKIMLSLCPEGTQSFYYTASDGSCISYSYTNFNKIHSGSQNLPTEIMQMACQKDARAIERYFIQVIIPVLDEARKKNAVLALKNIILKDKTIADTTQLGKISSLTKNELKAKNEFVLSEFLADIFIYAVAYTDNKVETSFTKSINKNFYANYTPMVDTITLYKPQKPKAIGSIPFTSKGNFNKVFTPVSSQPLSISCQHDLQIFSLKFDDFEFDYNGLWKYLRNNIGYYVYSRAEIKKYMDEDEISAIAYDAIALMKRAILEGKMTTENELGELLLYVFLEQVLKAPKFMSSVEIGNHGGVITSESSAIHLLTVDAVVPFSQIILGTSIINRDIKTAIDVAFSNAQNLKKRKGDERRFVEANIFAASFTEEICNQIEALILPSESKGKKPNTAFAMFLGYSLNGVAKNGKSIDAYQNDVLAQIQADILNNVPFIESKITQYNLDGYSIYIYLLPFSDADEDKKDIMNRLLQSGGGTI